jgi:hypothetical protein
VASREFVELGQEARISREFLQMPHRDGLENDPWIARPLPRLSVDAPPQRIRSMAPSPAQIERQIHQRRKLGREFRNSRQRRSFMEHVSLTAHQFNARRGSSIMPGSHA